MSETLQALRSEFDLSFAQARHADVASLQNLLAVRVGGDPYALRLDEIAGLFIGRRIVPMPAAVDALLGMAGFRGQAAPVYDLAALLGYARAATPRWLILVRGPHALALAFDAFDAHLAVAPDRLLPLADAAAAAPNGHAPRPHVCEAVRTHDGVRPVIRLQSVVEDVQQRVDATRSTKER